MISQKKEITLNSKNNFDSFSNEITSFCPFIKPANKSKLLYKQKTILTEKNIHEVKKEIFYYGILATEKFREERAKLAPNQKFLLCNNLIFETPETPDLIWKETFSWPHYLLKFLYTSEKIMFGKFWIGEEVTSRDGRAIPIPTSNFLSIRSAIKTKDPYFFKKSPELLDELNQSDETERNVHELFGLKKEDLNLNDLRRMDYYQTVYEHVHSLLKK